MDRRSRAGRGMRAENLEFSIILRLISSLGARRSSPVSLVADTLSPGEGIKRDIKMERNKKLTKTSQSLRKKLTKEEALLWYKFLCRYPFRFRRQYVIGNYIADFYCHKARLVVELDGSQHYEESNQLKETERTQYLQSQNLRILRYSNLDVLRKFQSVCEEIDFVVKERTAEEK